MSWLIFYALMLLATPWAARTMGRGPIVWTLAAIPLTPPLVWAILIATDRRGARS